MCKKIISIQFLISVKMKQMIIISLCFIDCIKSKPLSEEDFSIEEESFSSEEKNRWMNSFESEEHSMEDMVESFDSSESSEKDNSWEMENSYESLESEEESCEEDGFSKMKEDSMEESIVFVESWEEISYEKSEEDYLEEHLEETMKGTTEKGATDTTVTVTNL